MRVAAIRKSAFCAADGSTSIASEIVDGYRKLLHPLTSHLVNAIRLFTDDTYQYNTAIKIFTDALLVIEKEAKAKIVELDGLQDSAAGSCTEPAHTHPFVDLCIARDPSHAAGTPGTVPPALLDERKQVICIRDSVTIIIGIGIIADAIPIRIQSFR